LGSVPLFGVRQNGGSIEWKTAALAAEIKDQSVTFAWSAAMGGDLSRGANFLISVNGHAVAEFDAVMESTEFPCQANGCRLVYQVLFTKGAVDSSGHFFLTVPAAWVQPGQAAAVRVDGKDVGAGIWFALFRADDAPLVFPPRHGKMSHRVPRNAPGTPPPAGQEASYEWYVSQYPDPVIFTAIGPPADPAETGVSPRGQLMMGKLAYSEADGTIAGTPYVENSLAFGLVEDGRFVTVGSGHVARQSLVAEHLPIVLTNWNHDDLQIRETAFAQPLRGDGYSTGLEATLAWAVFEITHAGKDTREIAFAATQIGDEQNPRKVLAYHDGVVFEGESALFAVSAPAGCAQEFQPVLSPDPGTGPQSNRVELLRAGGIYNALVVRGRCEPGRTLRIAFCRVFQFPGTRHWGPSPVKVAAVELTGRSPDRDLDKAQATWNALTAGVSRFATPDVMLNRILARGMLDGYFLTKRWNGRHIAFDSVCYRCQWDDSSAKWFYALDLMGDHQTADRLLDTVFQRQGQRKPKGAQSSQGCFSDVTNIVRDGSDASWASCNGWALWSMAEHARLTNDRVWLAAHKRQILDGCDWILRERKLSLEQPDNPCAGLIRGKFVCDMPDDGKVSGVGYFTYTDAISYLGLHEIAAVLADGGHPEGQRLLDEADLYRRDIVAAVDRLTDKSREPWFVPWALHAAKSEHPYLNGVCGPINLAFARVLPGDDVRIQHVMRWNIEHTNRGSLEQSATASMFYSQDLAGALLEQGRVEDFLRMFYSILAANVTHETLSTCEWRTNTQPHLHSIASLVRMVRTMLIQERDGGLFLLQGVPQRWLEQGKRIQITKAPTWYGDLSLDCVSYVKDSTVRLRLSVPERLGPVPMHLKLRLPPSLRIGDVAVNGKAHGEVQGEWIVLRGLRGDVEILVRTALGPPSTPAPRSARISAPAGTAERKVSGSSGRSTVAVVGSVRRPAAAQ
jgi:hypothetical protein